MRAPRSTSSRPKRSTSSAGGGGLAAPEHDADAGEQLARLERLRHLVLRADLESDHAVERIAPGRSA